ncbi:conserved Plasmodium protein, unknown function [Plasmodium berghei]|uniref:Protoporphyrinogen oxidase n=2 Tax=Plasmodium berghei TaxID=5821 RepID=A0A509AH52_PLABA|nr:conserved Plasmodium protein, unknown function [Plasmodium berghei ANKA]CXI18614.1 conserved Plasmodium protein, unknown function [Plasmodium berghei]SCM19789.1 conserved Plasmodium protein, unknown function [Plasmodium berghei]SCN23531.1 conserved Plasmodium protein, unknown function [Plasmodium berghei]SCO59129.1 conserved Plasmodium protein, unknown function [Plasmodium berghei]SCO59853.1 conserved Plasmodium protein, unknown function [Plasmodium berghei]|eukprot:XP_034420642.1 conserved Plasmodium protein, unknown function [Plasmodium berghei ANKA]
MSRILGATRNICLVGGGTDSLCLSYYLQKRKVNIKLLAIKKKCRLINTRYYKSNIIEGGMYYSFTLNNKFDLFFSLIKDLNMEPQIIERNKYSNNISYLSENGKFYKINKYLFRIFFFILKDYFFRSSINVEKNERLSTFLLKNVDKKLCENLITPYLYYYFGYSSEHILMNSYFPDFVKSVHKNKSILKAIISSNNNHKNNKPSKNSNGSLKNKIIFRFKDGNVSLTNKLREYLDQCDNMQWIENTRNFKIEQKGKRIKINIGRESIKCSEIIFCLNPFELRNLLKKKNIKIKNKNIMIKYLFRFSSKNLIITNVCYKNNVLPFSHTLESLLLFKKSSENKLISLSYDNNIFPQFTQNQTCIENLHQKLETRLRFTASEQDNEKLKLQIFSFLKNVLKIKETPDLVISEPHIVFHFDEMADKNFKKLIRKKNNKIKIFWDFAFFKNMEFCLSRTKKFCDDLEKEIYKNRT